MTRQSNIKAADARARFVNALEAHRRALASTGTESKGPNKVLAERMRVSPTRVAEFLRQGWHLKLDDEGKIKQPDQLRKIVLGFATSVERALCWLTSTDLVGEGRNVRDDIRDLRIEDIVQAYWPTRPPIVVSVFKSRDVERAIEDGSATARQEFKKLTTIDVELWITEWGPFAKDEQYPRSFYSLYGEAIFRGIDPVDTDTKPVFKDLAE